MKITDLAAPPKLVAAWGRDLQDLTAVQESAVAAGILEGAGNLLIVAPTSSGKTLVGEMAAANIALTGRRHVFLAVPMKSLAEEHFFRLEERYRGLIGVVISTGERLEYDDDIRHGRFDLAVTTYEKLAALLIQEPSLLPRCGAVVIDEGQMIGDEHRGDNLEVLVTHLLIAPSSPRLVLLSASLDDLNHLDDWLHAKAIVHSERPVPLDLAVCSAQSGRALLRRPGRPVEEIKMCDPPMDVETLAECLALKYAEEGQQVIVFRSGVASTSAMARSIASRRTASGIDPGLNERLLDLEDADAVKEFADLMSCGVSYHNADRSAEERRLVENAFRAGHVRILVSTTTLAMGVNMPADVVIVADYERFQPRRGGGWDRSMISVAEFRNAAGRAGRLGVRDEGLAILVAPDDLRRRQLFNHYIDGRVERVESQIPKSQLQDVVFRLLAGRVAGTEEALVEFVLATFAYLTFYESHGGHEAVRAAVAQAVDAAVKSGLVADRAGHLLATPAARTFAGAGISLATAVQLKAVLDRIITAGVLEADIVYAISRVRESGPRPYAVRQVDARKRWDFTEVPHDTGGPLGDVLNAIVLSEEEHQALEQTACLLNWMDGDPSRDLHRNFKMTRERLRNMGGQAAWLLQALASAAKSEDVAVDRVRALRDMALKAQHGLPAELAPLASLRPAGVSREALMELRQIGIVDPDDLLESDPAALQPALSPLQAERFKEAVLRETAMSVRRKRTGHLRAAVEVGVPAKLIETLYSATGGALEAAVRDAFETAGLAAKRILNQPAGEEDIQVATARGTVVVSVTGSADDQKPIKWTKAQDVMGQGAGLNPINCVCVGRPRFEGLAERNAREIAREGGDRKILLMPVDILAEAVIRCSAGQASSDQLGELLATARGVLTVDELPAAHGAEQPMQAG